MKIRLIKQAPGEETCGAAVLAMCAGIGLESAQWYVGYGRVRARTLLVQIGKWGWAAGSDARGRPKARTALGFWRGPRGRGHWVLWHEGAWLCPDRGRCVRVPVGWRLERHWPLQRLAD